MKKDKKTDERIKSENSKRLNAVLEAATGFDSKYDPAGSYTGNPRDGTEHPVQDADDL